MEWRRLWCGIGKAIPGGSKITLILIRLKNSLIKKIFVNLLIIVVFGGQTSHKVTVALDASRRWRQRRFIEDISGQCPLFSL